MRLNSHKILIPKQKTSFIFFKKKKDLNFTGIPRSRRTLGLKKLKPNG